MSSAGIAAQERSQPLKSFLHRGRELGGLGACWGGGQFDSSFFSVDPARATCLLDSPTTPPCGLPLPADPARAPGETQGKHADPDPEDGAVLGFARLSLAMSRAADGTPPLTPVKGSAPLFLLPARPLPPLPVHQDFPRDEMDREVEFLTSSDTDVLLAHCGSPAFKPAAQGRRSFRGCGQINYAYFGTPECPKAEEAPKQSRPAAGGGSPPSPPPPPPPSQPLHRKLRRSHSGPAGSFHKPTVRGSHRSHRASPSSDEDKPEVPPRVPIPPRVAKPDYRRWSAEVASSTYSDEDKPPKVPPREPLSRSNSRTPSPKSLPLYLNGVMPPTQSFAPDPKYVSSKSLRRQCSEDAAKKSPCILPIIENGKKVSSTHYYLLPERPPYLDKYEKFFREAEEAAGGEEGQRQPQLWETGGGNTAGLTLMAKSDLVGPVKRKHLPCMVSP